MVAYDQVAYVCEEYNNFQDSKLIFMTSDFKHLPVMLLRHLNFSVLLVQQPFHVYYKGKTPFFFNL